MDDLVVVDCQHDFIDGSLACMHGLEAVRNLVDFINANNVRVLYTSDWHQPTNKSFEINGGIWPVHCVQETHGATLHEAFTTDVKRAANRPSKDILFLKGIDDEVEEYSAFHGHNGEGRSLSEIVSNHVYVGGIASEFCVMETVKALLEAGHRVSLLADGIGYVTEDGHEKAMESYRGMGVDIL